MAAMSHNLKPWLELFRLPNLPSAPGDAVSGAAIAFLCLPQEAGRAPVWQAVLAAAAAALLLYMFGLADNDMAGAEADRTEAPGRPIPSGRLSVGAVAVARTACLLGAFAVGFAARLPSAWFVSACALALVIGFYNHAKDRLPRVGLAAMGLCRGLSVFAGAMALPGPSAATFRAALAALLGWTAYVAALTALAADEHRAGEPLPRRRRAWGLSALLPLLTLPFLPAAQALAGGGAPSPSPQWPLLAIPLGSLAASLAWRGAVAPLRHRHTPALRRQAVGRAIGALLYLQAGFALATGRLAFVAPALACFAARRAVRKVWPAISGS